MSTVRHSMKGFTLIASLLLLLLLSGMSIGLMFMISGSSHISGNDMETSQAYYQAQSAIEQLTVNLATVYQGNLSPKQTDLDSMTTSSQASAASLFPGTTFLESASWTNPKGDGTGLGSNNVISQGTDAGLTALLVPVTVQVTAIRPSGAAVSMTRGVEAAIIPVFQFGVFSQSDLSYFAGPEFNFQGRVHTNGNLFLAANNGPLIFGSKVTAVGEIIRDQLANGFAGGTGSYYGDVYVPNQTGGCDSYIAANGTKNLGANCINVGPDTDNAKNDASWSGGYPTGGGPNAKWTTLSKGTFNSMLGNKTSIGVQPLQLPFVQSNVAGQQADPIEIIRKPELTTESPTSPLGGSREFNKANIRILLGDTEAELHPTGSADDAEDIQLEAQKSETLTNGGLTAYFAVADNSTSTVTSGGNGSSSSKAIVNTKTIVDPYWNSLNGITPFLPPCGNDIPPNCTAYPGTTKQWPLVRGWLRVEYLGIDGAWHGVTQEWLKYGFAKSPAIARTAPGVDIVGHKDAILILQQIADRDGDGAITNKTIQLSSVGPVKVGGLYTTTVTQTVESTASTGGAATATNFYPINFYDAREGFPRDSAAPLVGTQGYANGIMSAVELDVGNLAAWIAAKNPGDYAGSSGPSIDATPQAGYLVYFSDRRGMEPNPNATDGSGNPLPNVTNGESGLEDVINSGSATGTPDGTLEAKSGAYTPPQSPEDVDDNGLLDNWGYKDIGYGFGTALAVANPYLAVDCINGGRQNWVSGARRVLKLVDGSLGNLPIPGFTVASENPVYVQGDYNSNSGDTVWNAAPVDVAHSNASIIADAVTLLSNSWTDINSMKNPSTLNNRNRTQTYYRMAIAAGKNMNFPKPLVGGVPNDFGTDGGLHNFLRMLEQTSAVNYRGSLVSLYYSEYATGVYKCCTLVYGAPTRNFSFDTDFLNPANLPPGTPELQDVVNLSYWQSFTPCTTQANGKCTN
jgi:type II secretory pathway pseudopilin PulG